MKTLEQINQELDEKIPRSAVKERSGGGQSSFSYLSTDYVIDRLNKVLGNLSWDSETVEMVQLPTEKVSYRAKVRVTATVQVAEGQYLKVTKEGTGYGADKNQLNPHEMAAKEAESDALKRAAMKFGQSMGLALYSKDQENVVEDSPAAPTPVPNGSRPSAAGQHSDRPQGAPSNRETLNRTINSLSKIVSSKGVASVEAIKAKMREKYGTDDKEKLTDAQAAELKAELEKMAG